MQSVQDVSNGRFNIASINVKRNIPVFLKRTAVLWPIAAAYFYWSWNRVFDSSRQYRGGKKRTELHHVDFEPFAAADRLIKVSLAQAAGNKRTPAPAEPRNDWEDPKVITKMFFDGRKY